MSGNTANKIGRGYRRGGIPYPKLVKTPQAEAYMAAGALVCRAAKPSGWKWSGGYIITEWRLYLARHIDASNVEKSVEDILFPVLGVDDKWDLPRVMSIEIVPAAEARVEITVIDEGENHA